MYIVYVLLNEYLLHIIIYYYCLNENCKYSTFFFQLYKPIQEYYAIIHHIQSQCNGTDRKLIQINTCK